MLASLCLSRAAKQIVVRRDTSLSLVRFIKSLLVICFNNKLLTNELLNH